MDLFCYAGPVMFGAQHTVTDHKRGQTGVGVGVVVLVRQVHRLHRAGTGGATSPGAHSDTETPHQGSSFYKIHCCWLVWLIRLGKVR